MTEKRLYWHQVFHDLKGAPLLEEDTLDEIVYKACDWHDCACGSQDPRIPRYKRTDVPLDEKLRELGQMFGEVADYSLTELLYEGLSEDELLELQNLAGFILEELMEEIEKRAAEILKEVK